MDDHKITILHEADGVWASWVEVPNVSSYPYAVVQDVAETAQLRFGVSADGRISASFSAPIAGRFASYTHDLYDDFSRTEISITDEGLLTALAAPVGSQISVVFRRGFTVALPVHFVAPIRLAIAQAFEASEKRVATEIGAP